MVKRTGVREIMGEKIMQELHCKQAPVVGLPAWLRAARDPAANLCYSDTSP